MEIFITSDTHYGHANIIKYCNRPFSSVEEMNEAMIANHNSVVGKNDAVIHCGDFALTNDHQHAADILNRLNGFFQFIRGNHEKTLLDIDKKGLASGKIINIADFLEITYKDIPVVFFHYPISSWNRKFHGAIHCYGHVHNNPYDPPKGRAFNVSVEMTNYTPLHMDEIVAKAQEIQEGI